MLNHDWLSFSQRPGPLSVPVRDLPSPRPGILCHIQPNVFSFGSLLFFFFFLNESAKPNFTGLFRVYFLPPLRDPEEIYF
jgi:hypothetical protein